MPFSKNHSAQFLGQLPFFSGLPQRDMEVFLRAGAMCSYGKNECLFLRGDGADRFFIVLSGWVKLCRETLEGEETVTGLLTRGDVFGEAAIFGGGRYSFSAYAAEKSRLLEIPAAALKDRARASTEVMQKVMAAMAHEVRRFQMESEHLSLMAAPQRVGCLLLRLSAGMKGMGGTFTFPYDKSLAAARLGMKPETFSRALSQLKPAGVRVMGSEISIENFERLSALSCHRCSFLPGECDGCRMPGQESGVQEKIRTGKA